MFPSVMLVLFIAALVMCSIGFKKFVWFMSVGYGLAVGAIGLVLLIYFMKSMTLIKALICLCLIVYGLRLGLFLLLRELKSASYRANLAAATKTDKPIPFFVKAVMWLVMGALYVAETSAITYRLSNGAGDNLFAWIGFVVMAVATLIEALADKQKADAKLRNPKRFCDEGLYKFVRCPNYFGEMLFWTGLLISGIGAVRGSQWIIVLLGWIMIIYIMLSGAKGIETKQEKRYGEMEDFRSYTAKTPLIFPFTSLYSLKNVKWLR